MKLTEIDGTPILIEQQHLDEIKNMFGTEGIDKDTVDTTIALHGMFKEVEKELLEFEEHLKVLDMAQKFSEEEPSNLTNCVVLKRFSFNCITCGCILIGFAIGFLLF